MRLGLRGRFVAFVSAIVIAFGVVLTALAVRAQNERLRQTIAIPDPGEPLGWDRTEKRGIGAVMDHPHPRGIHTVDQFRQPVADIAGDRDHTVGPAQGAGRPTDEIPAGVPVGLTGMLEKEQIMGGHDASAA